MEDADDTFKFNRLDELNELQSAQTFRQKLKVVLQSTATHVSVVILVILDICFVLAALLVDFSKKEDDTEEESLHKETAATALVFASLTVISVFIIEVMLKLYAFGPREFVSHKLEMFDAIVVVISFGLDIYETTLIGDLESEPALGLFVVLRLWRITRIINGVVLQVKSQEEKKLSKEKELRRSAEAEVSRLKSQVEQLKETLTSHGIEVDISHVEDETLHDTSTA